MIKVTTSKTVLSDPAALARLELPLAVAQATAQVIRKRAMAGRFATAPGPYKGPKTDSRGHPRRYRVSAEYAAKVGLGDKMVWESSRDFAQAAGSVPGNTTGGLWDHVTVRNHGTDALIEFTSTSPGSRARTKARTVASKDDWVVTTNKDGKTSAKRKRVLRRDDDGKVIRSKASDRVANRLKASVVFRNTKIGLLQPTDSETQAQSSAVMEALANATARCFTANVDLQVRSDGDPMLRNAIRVLVRR